jgi:hypothetical protein
VVRQVFIDGSKRGLVVTVRVGGGLTSMTVESCVHASSQLDSAVEFSLAMLFI